MAEGLSKAYGLDKLRQLREGGHLDDDAQCTGDSGQSWVSLADLLSTGASDVTVPVSVPKRPVDAGQSESSAGSSHIHEISELRDRLTAEEMFERRGRLSPTSRRPDLREPSSRPTPTKVKDNRSDSSHAAADALRTIRKSANESSTSTDSPLPRVEKQSGQTLILLVTGVLGGLIGGGSVAVLASLLSGNNLSPIVTDNSFEPMSVAELTAQVRVMGVQLKHVARAASVDIQNVPIPTRLQANGTPKVVLIPYIPRTPTTEQRDTMNEIIRQYGKLIRTDGPDGRKMSSQTVDLFSERLSTLMAWPGSPTSSRAEAANDLVEKCKLLYLLQLHNTRSDDPERQDKGRRILLEATDQGLSKLFPEFATHDLRFMEIFKAAVPDVQRELMLIRYWYYRSLNGRAADEWLERMQKISHEDHQTYVNESIIEVDNIE